MTEFLTPEQLAARTSAALAAAVAAGRDLGLTVTEPEILHDLFSVVVHLAPAPVVARVPTVLAGSTDLDALAARQRDELAVVRWLADRGVPVVPPSPLVPPEPVRRDGFSLTLWQWTEEDHDREPDYAANAELTAALHAALADYPGPLDHLATAEPGFVTDSLTALADLHELLAPADLDRARREWAALEPLVRSREAFEKRFPGVELRPIHGDSPPANIFASTSGPLYADFELVTLGPVEWDLASLGPELEAAYDRGAARAGLRPLDPEVMNFVNAVGRLRALACLVLVPSLPVLGQYLTPAVDHWRTTPFAGGLTL
ncbi:phosphotransferase family protein (plasmid) [Streptomyces sp. BI20]|uniref:phosphotransferase family protein n=1 Tax=Streptomyces sp. BI20 TaxID=3403460 RepID=UPI003C78CD7C